MAFPPASSCLQSGYFCPAYFTEKFNRQDILAALGEHVSLVARSVAIALVIAVPLALAVRRRRWARGLAVGVTGLLYTVPSVAAFAILSAFISPVHDTAAVIVLTAYNLLVLLRNVLVGLDGVPPEAVEAARGMGFGRARIVWRVELPLALPAIVAGLRIATVLTIGITTVGALLGFGGLGALLLQGIQAHPAFHAKIATALVLCVVLAIVADLALLLAARLLAPWQRKGGRA